MFEDILKMVKDHFAGNTDVAAAIPAHQADDIHNEIATHIHDNMQNQAAAAPQASDAGGGILSSIEHSIAGGGMGAAIAGGFISSLASKFGLPPSITGMISGSLPGLMQKLEGHGNAGTATAAAPTS